MGQADLVQVGLAFLEGLALILSPCILPILPVVLATSLEGGRARPVGIVAGFIASFTLFALVSRGLLSALDVDPSLVRDVALILLASLGLVMMSHFLSDKLLAATQGLANVGLSVGDKFGRRQGFWGGVGIGALIGLVWTPCAGPILAAVIVQIVQATSEAKAAFALASFALGAGVPMLIIALTGRRIVDRMTFFKKHAFAVRRALGAVVIAFAAMIAFGLDTQLLAASAGGGGGEAMTQQQQTPGALKRALAHPYPAPEIVEGGAWVNSPPLKIADLRGKVVLIDFWTYSCINCVRTLPYITKWDEKYRDKGLVIIGVHAPEFAFERKLENVQKAVARYGIRYPVVQDNDLKTWTRYDNHYWPAHYLIDQEGRVVYTHFGEGEYDVTENNIRALLGLEEERAQESEVPYVRGQTPETYLGYARAEGFVGEPGIATDVAQTYAFPAFLPLNSWALKGRWLVEPESIAALESEAALRLNFFARKAFLVLGTKDGAPIKVRILLNGHPAKELTVEHATLYELLDLDKPQNALLELQTERPGLQAYAFTFGG